MAARPGWADDRHGVPRTFIPQELPATRDARKGLGKVDGSEDHASEWPKACS